MGSDPDPTAGASGPAEPVESVPSTAQNEVGRILRLVLKRPADAWRDPASVVRQWEPLNYREAPDLGRAIAEYERFQEFFRDRGVEIDVLPEADGAGLDSIYVRDAAVVTDGGVILCNMGKPARSEEPAAQGAYYASRDIPVLGAITGDGRLEGGDVVWLGPRTLAVGLGYRTNQEGIRQLGALARDHLDELTVVPLPHWKGPSDVFHLMSLLSPVDTDLALVFSPLLPVPFQKALLALGIELVETPRDEFDMIGANVLALAPREVLMVDAQPGVRSRLEGAGVEVHVFQGNEISLKGCGGPTCLTRPLERAVEMTGSRI